jgi:hypothetical protein
MRPETRGTRFFHSELERMICRAVLEEEFGNLLITAPEQALRDYQGLSSREYSLVVSIKNSTDIHDFAAQLYTKLNPAGMTGS